MPTPTSAYLTSFSYRAAARLTALTRELVGALATGDETRMSALVYEGQLLSHGLRSCANANNQLSDSQRVYIAGKLLPLLREPTPSFMPATPITFSFDPLSARIRGQLTSSALVISGLVSGPVPSGTELIVSRDGLEIRRQALGNDTSYRYVDASPGKHYRVELTGLGLSREQLRPLASGLLLGTLPHGASPAQLAALPWLTTGLVAGVARASFAGNRNRIFLCIPQELGTLRAITQPTDQDADISAAFTPTSLVLDFGADGSSAYRVFESSANFLGPLVIDLHLAALVTMQRMATLVMPTVLLPVGSATFSTTFTNQSIVLVVHSLGHLANPQIFNLQGEEIEGAITASDINSFTVTFSQPLSGTIFVN